MDNYDTNFQIYDTSKCVEINYMQKCFFGILEKQEQTPLQITGFAIFLPTFEVQ